MCMSPSRGIMTLLVLLAALLVRFSAFGAEPRFDHRSSQSEIRPTIRLDSNLVLVPVSVIDSQGRLVAGLRESDFTLHENDSPQQLLSFSRETAPISLGLVVDLTGSMANKLAKTQIAVNEILKNLEPADEEFLVTFSETPRLKVAFTRRVSDIREALSFANVEGRTPLYDAIALAMRQMRNARNERKVLFLISDGGDNHSRTTKREVRRIVGEADVQIHAIGIHDGSGTVQDRIEIGILDDLAAMTGGQHYLIHDAAELPELASKISLALHDRYLLGYRPEPAGPPGTFRRIDVKVARPKGKRLSVYARHGYWMP
jgi:Ca-activated chloride channel homolog